MTLWYPFVFTPRPFSGNSSRLSLSPRGWNFLLLLVLCWFRCILPIGKCLLCRLRGLLCCCCCGLFHCNLFLNLCFLQCLLVPLIGTGLWADIPINPLLTSSVSFTMFNSVLFKDEGNKFSTWWGFAAEATGTKCLLSSATTAATSKSVLMTMTKEAATRKPTIMVSILRIWRRL